MEAFSDPSRTVGFPARLASENDLLPLLFCFISHHCASFFTPVAAYCRVCLSAILWMNIQLSLRLDENISTFLPSTKSNPRKTSYQGYLNSPSVSVPTSHVSSKACLQFAAHALSNYVLICLVTQFQCMGGVVKNFDTPCRNIWDRAAKTARTLSMPLTTIL